MPDTGKIKPQVTARGLFLPWPLVAGLLLSGLVPLWILSVKAVYIAENVSAVVESDRSQNDKLTTHAERLAALEAKGTR